MKIKQIYTGCLSQGTYYIESDGEVAIIDPLREVEPYISEVKKNNATIKYIFETHFHADFVSGHVTLSKQTGAPIIYGPNANPLYKAIIAKDGDSFKIGRITITALHTPGHTMESTTFLLKDENGKDHAIFSGDTLFLGDVGRPDLAQKSDISKEELAGLLFDSLRNKIMVLNDDVIVYPAHGSGSACGKNMSNDTMGFLGEQKRSNYALRPDMTKEDFITEVTNELLPPPIYFPSNVKLNKEGYEDINNILKKGLHPLEVDEFEGLAESSGAIILDVRNKDEYSKEHIPKSIFIGIEGSFAPWVGTLIGNINQPLLLVTPDGKEEEAITRLSRVGFDNILGYLKGGLNTWTANSKAIDSVRNISANKLSEHLLNKDASIIDVRKKIEFDVKHVTKAKNIPLSFLNDSMEEFTKNNGKFYIHCASGYRSIIAASILKGRGIHDFLNISGGIQSIKKTNILLETNDV